MIHKKNILYLLLLPSTCLFADRYIEDEIGGGGSDNILIYLIFFVVGWLAISTIINIVKDAIRQTKEEIDFQSGLCKSVSFVAGMCICKEKYKENAPEFFMCGS